MKLRLGVRLTQPDNRTDEVYSSGAITLSVNVSFDILTLYAAAFPVTGPDTLNITYVDDMGQSNTYTVNLTLWMSDAGYVFVSTDGSKQFLIAGIDGPFFDLIAPIINARNVTSAATALTALGNTSRYDYTIELSNQTRPTTLIRDGVIYTEFYIPTVVLPSITRAIFDPSASSQNDTTADP